MSATPFYIEAIENTIIKIEKIGSPVVGEALYGENNLSPSESYTYGSQISLLAGDKCYWSISSTSDDFSDSNYLKFTSTGSINVGGSVSSLIGNSSSIPREYCFYHLFNNCSKLIDASNLDLELNFNSKQYCYELKFNSKSR